MVTPLNNDALVAVAAAKQAGREGNMTTSPPRPPSKNTTENKDERPRFFDAKAKKECWAKAEVVPGRHPERWRKDVAGNIVCKRFWNCLGCLCYEYDHIVPFSKGGESTSENCQILQSRVNRFKSNKESLKKDELQSFSCDMKFTDKELDLVEMAVYGDVVRPGKQCRVRILAEMLGQYKPKNSLPTCETPFNGST